jgi:hypothetical protein
MESSEVIEESELGSESSGIYVRGPKGNNELPILCSTKAYVILRES